MTEMAEITGSPANRFSGASLVVLLCVTTFVLTSAVPALYIATTSATRLARNAVADACVEALEDAPSNAVNETVELLRVRYDLASITLRPAGTPTGSPRNDVVYRPFRDAVAEITFRSGSAALPARGVDTLMVISVIASIASMFILAYNLVALLRPSRLRPQGVTDNAAYLQTVQSSIQQLRGHASELDRLRAQEKERADELATVTGTLVRSLNSGFIAIDGHGGILDLNVAARELLLVPPTFDATGRTLVEMLGPSEFANTVQEAIDGREALQRREVAEPGPDGATFGVTTVPLFDANGRDLGMLVLFTDLGPIRRLETRMRQMQALAEIGEMSAGIAHEFRNSLGTVLGYLRLASKTPQLSQESLDRIDRAADEARRLNDVVESLLSFARPMPLQRTSVDLDDLLAGIAGQLTPLAGVATLHLDTEPVAISGDALLLGRALENVVRNAIDAVREKGSGEVRIVTRATPAPTVIISDTGVGLDEAQAAQFFLPFHTKKAGGVGLGLALARKIVLLHGGSIELRGTPGIGATATITFPQSTPS